MLKGAVDVLITIPTRLEAMRKSTQRLSGRDLHSGPSECETGTPGWHVTRQTQRGLIEYHRWDNSENLSASVRTTGISIHMTLHLDWNQQLTQHSVKVIHRRCVYQLTVFRYKQSHTTTRQALHRVNRVLFRLRISPHRASNIENVQPKHSSCSL
jgi:hypothetical protein